jgi:hypothetical protein
MKIFHYARVPLLTLMLLASLILANSAYAAAPVTSRTAHKVFSTHWEAGGSCPFSGQSYGEFSSATDD